MSGRSAFNKRFSDDYSSLIRSKPDQDHSAYVLSVLKSSETPTEEVWYVRHTLVGELRRLNRFSEAAQLLSEDARSNPDNPFPLVALADHYLYYEMKPATAKPFLRRAVTLAKHARMGCYYALGTQARVAIETSDWRLLTKTLKDLTSYRHKTGNDDTFPETDFLEKIPPNAVPARVIAAYVKRRRYLSTIGYSTLNGRGNKVLSNSRSKPTRTRAARAVHRKR